MHRPAQGNMTISVVLPVFNEEGALGELYQRLHEAIAEIGAREEIIFVNDGSRDGSGLALDELAAMLNTARPAPDVKLEEAQPSAFG